MLLVAVVPNCCPTGTVSISPPMIVYLHPSWAFGTVLGFALASSALGRTARREGSRQMG